MDEGKPGSMGRADHLSVVVRSFYRRVIQLPGGSQLKKDLDTSMMQLPQRSPLLSHRNAPDIGDFRRSACGWCGDRSDVRVSTLGEAGQRRRSSLRSGACLLSANMVFTSIPRPVVADPGHLWARESRDTTEPRLTGAGGGCGAPRSSKSGKGNSQRIFESHPNDSESPEICFRCRSLKDPVRGSEVNSSENRYMAYGP